MADNPSQPRKPSWRDGSTRAARGGTDQPKSKGTQIFVLLAIMLFLVGGGAAWLFIIHSVARPYFLPVSVTQYIDKHIPVNHQADEDSKALGNEGFFGTKLTKGFAIQEREQIVQEFRNLKSKGKEESVVVLLCAHAVCDAKGELYLLPANAEIDKPDGWIEVRKLLDGLKDCPSRRKLLILDLMRPIAEPRLGVLANDVSTRLTALLELVPDDDRLVLTACAPGQVSFSSEELRQSAFGFYLEEGLRGWADGYGANSKGKDGRITVDELARFVKARVDRWVKQNRDGRQTPMLYGPEKLAREFELVALSNKPAPPVETMAADPYPEWLQHGWRLRNLWWKDRTFRIAPRTFRKLEAALLRNEQLWRGGVRTSELQSDFEGQQVAQFRKDVDRAWNAIPRPEKTRSLALAAALPRPGDLEALDAARKAALAKAAADKAAAEKAAAEKGSEKKPEGSPPSKKSAEETPAEKKADPAYSLAANVEALRKLLNRLDDFRSVEPKEAVKMRDAQYKEFLGRFKGKPAFDLAWTVFEAAAQEVMPRPERIRYLNELLTQGEQPMPQYVETLLLRRLNDLAEMQGASDVPPWSPEAVRRALQVTRDGERCLALDTQREGGWEPRALPWLRLLFESAGQKRHDAEVLLLNPGYGSTQKAIELFRDAAADYQTILGHLEALQAAFNTYDEALVYLPGLAPALMNQPEIDSRDEKNWAEAVSTLIVLHRLLHEPPRLSAGLRDQVNDIQKRANDLRGIVDLLMRPYAAGLKATMDKARRSDTLPTLWPEINAAFEVPWLDAEQRVELWNASRALAGRLLEKTRTLDLDELQRERPTDAPPDPDTARAVALEDKRAAWRAQVAVDLFRLGGLSGMDKLEADIAQAAREPAKPTTWPEIGDRLRRAWGEEGVAKQLKEVVDPIARDLLSRAAHPFDDPPTLGEADAHPRLELQMKQATEYWAWLYERAQYEVQETKGLRLAEDNRTIDTICQTFFETLRDDYQRLAGDRPAMLLGAEMIGKSNRPAFTRSNRSGQYLMQLLLSRPSPKLELAVNPETPDPAWLRLQPRPVPALKEGETAAEVGVDIEVPGNAGEQGTVQPRGFLVQARVNGRSFHHRVPVSLPTPDNQQLQLILAKNPVKPEDSAGSQLRLRPNARQLVYVFVRNPTKTDKNVLVEVLPKDNPKLGARTSKPVTIKAGGVPTPIIFDNVRGPTPAAGDGKSAAPLPVLKGPLQVILRDPDNKDAMIGEPRELDVVIQAPSEYVRVTRTDYQPNTNRLSVTVRAEEPIVGDPCLVRLELPRSRISGFLRAKGNAEDKIEGDKQEVELTAEGMEFEDQFSQRWPGFFYVHVDDYERAFIYQIVFVRAGAGNPPVPVRSNTRALRVVCTEVLAPNQPFVARIEVDNAPGVRLIYGQDRTRKNSFIDKPALVGERDMSVGFSPAGPEGALLFETKVRDWRIEDVNVRGISGPWDFRVQMLQGRNQLGEIKRTIIVDETPPERVRITAVGKTEVGSTSETRPLGLGKGGIYRIKAEGTDPESNIKQVYFFLGEPVDSARPPKTKVLPAQSLDGDNTLWWADVPISGTSREVQRVTVEFINGAGLSSFDTLYVQIQPDDEAGGKANVKKAAKNAVIRGRVTENDRGQQNELVVLKDDNNPTAKPRTTRTKAQGFYEFKDVPPGSYTLQVIRDMKAKATGRADVEAGDEKKVDLDITF